MVEQSDYAPDPAAPPDDPAALPLKRLDGATRIVRAAAALGALAVPTALLIQARPLPDGMGRIALVLCGVVAVGVTLAIAMLGRRKRGRGGRAAAMLFVTLAAAIAATIGYMVLAERLTIPIEEPGRTVLYIKPLTQSDALRNEMAHFEDYEEALVRNKTVIEPLLREDALSATLLLFTLLLLAQGLFVAAIVGGAWWLTGAQSEAPPL